MPTLRRLMTSVLFILISFWLLLSLILYFFQEQYVYYPVKPLIATPDQVRLAYEEVSLVTEDNVRLHGWYLPRSASRNTLLFLHGNAGNISHRLDSLLLFHDLGLNVLIIDYRGYGRSEGKPSEQGTYLDAQAAWNHLTETRGIAAGGIVIFGRSLGGAVAAWLADRTRPAALILESTFTSVRDMGRHYYPYLPVSLLARIRYPAEDYVRSLVDVPLLVIHSVEDEIIPFEFGLRLYEAADGPRQLLRIRGGHNEGFLISGEQYRNGIDAFLKRHVER